MAVAINPDGEINVESLRRDWQFFVDQGWTKGPVAIEKVVDLTFVKAADKELGSYKSKN